MQEIDIKGLVRSSKELDGTHEEQAREIQAALERYGTSHVVVGELPCRGDLVTINGLKYSVMSRSKDGNLHLKLVKVSDAQKG